MKPEHKHNLINLLLISLPTVGVSIVYFLSGGDFTRNDVLGFTTAAGFIFSSIAAFAVTSSRNWK